MKSIIKEDKKGFLRIVEAFIGVIIIFTVLLVLMTRPDFGADREGEILEIERHVLDQVSQSEALRNEVFDAHFGSGDLSNVEKLVEDSIPEGYQYRLKTCNLDEVCTLGFYVDAEVITEELLITSNLTQYSPLILKLFLWYGEIPEGECEVDCEEDAKRCKDTQTVEECKSITGTDCNKWVDEDTCNNSASCDDGECIITPACVINPDCDDNIDCTVDSCSEGVCAHNSASCVANLGINFVITKVQVEVGSSGCNINRCYYKTTIINNGEGDGEFGIEEFWSGTTHYPPDSTFNEIISSGDNFTMPENTYKSGCYDDFSYTFIYKDKSGSEIGKKDVTCAAP